MNAYQKKALDDAAKEAGIGIKEAEEIHELMCKYIKRKLIEHNSKEQNDVFVIGVKNIGKFIAKGKKTKNAKNNVQP